MAKANPNPDDSDGEWAPVKKWLKKLRAEVAALLGETPVPPPPPPKRKATADVGTSTGSLPYYIAARKRRR